jgi:acyl carrier protein
MRPNRDAIDAHLRELLGELAKDWDYSRPVGPDTKLFSELGFESLDAVVLGTAIQEHYQRSMPFAELLTELGQEQRDLTVGELVDFVDAQLAGAAVTEAR